MPSMLNLHANACFITQCGRSFEILLVIGGYTIGSVGVIVCRLVGGVIAGGVNNVDAISSTPLGLLLCIIIIMNINIDIIVIITISLHCL